MIRAQRAILFVGLMMLLASGAGAQSTPIRVLLTNDDGFEAAGLRIMREGLIAAGLQVTVSAPAQDFSGASASTTTGVIKVDDHGNNIWAVHGTPADSVLVGLMHIMRDAPPDIVVSGTNRGQNLGTSTNGSGTVGAAITAANAGYPAIAISAGIGADAANVARAYQLAADVVRQVIAALSATRPAGGKLLPPRLVININQPALAADRLKGIKIAPLSRRGSFMRQYEATEMPGEVRARFVLAPAGDETETDIVLFAAGYTTVTVLDGDWSVDAAGIGAPVLSRISGVALKAAPQ
jgi:5'/3'-nucleotidase